MHPLPNDNALTRRARPSGVLRFMHKNMLFSLLAAWARKTCIKILVKYGLSGGASKSVGGSEVGGQMQQPQGPSLFFFFKELHQCISHQPLFVCQMHRPQSVHLSCRRQGRKSLRERSRCCSDGSEERAELCCVHLGLVARHLPPQRHVSV